MEKEWFYLKNGVVGGPVARQTLRKLADEEHIELGTPIKRGEDGRWQKASDMAWIFPSSYLKEDEKHPAPRLSKPDSEKTGGFFLEGPIICPHCWHNFLHESILYISRHQELIGDPVLGDVQQRFLPSRFNSRGHAIDSRGMECEDLACPRCHLKIPDSVTKLSSLYFSIIGAPSSGKSYFLTSMINRIRKNLSRFFDYSFIDADTVFNSVVNDYEQLLFANTSPDSFVTLPKTDLRGDMFSTQITLDRMIMDLPKPFVYKIEPLLAHVASRKMASDLTRNIVLYDNAGEHFLPGQENPNNPATKHLTYSNGLIFLFDPSIDSDMRLKCESEDPQLKDISKIVNQSVLLSEMICRVGKNIGLKPGEKYENPLIVLVSKYDMWESLLCDDIRNITPWKYDSKEKIYKFDYNAVANVSYHMREMMFEFKPDIVTAAESFSKKVFFLPVSALGSPCVENRSPTKAGGRAYGTRPSQINPLWCETPILLLLALSGYIPICGRSEIAAEEPVSPHFNGDNVGLLIPGTDEMIRLPSVYFGTTLFDTKSEKWFRVPGTEKSTAINGNDGGDFWDN